MRVQGFRFNSYFSVNNAHVSRANNFHTTSEIFKYLHFNIIYTNIDLKILVRLRR